MCEATSRRGHGARGTLRQGQQEKEQATGCARSHSPRAAIPSSKQQASIPSSLLSLLSLPPLSSLLPSPLCMSPRKDSLRTPFKGGTANHTARVA